MLEQHAVLHIQVSSRVKAVLVQPVVDVCGHIQLDLGKALCCLDDYKLNIVYHCFLSLPLSACFHGYGEQ